MRIKYTYLSVILLLFAVACTRVRNLHDTTGARLEVEGSWSKSLGIDDMYDATVLLHKADGSRGKEYLSRPNGTTTRVKRGDYDVMVFNGVMVSEEETNLDHVFFRGTDSLGSFEAYAARGNPLPRLPRHDDEYIASNEMELLTFAHHRVYIDADENIYVRYDNGKYTGTEASVAFLAGRVESVPRAVSFRFQVLMNGIINPVSARNVTGSLRGFLGSAYMPYSGERPRPGFRATHHLTFTQPKGTRTRVDMNGSERGELVSQTFVTFGPPLPQTEDEVKKLPRTGVYFFEPVFLLRDGTEYAPGIYDVTDQVNRTIRRMLEHHGDGEDISLDENIFEIVIDDVVTLPIVEDDGGNGGGGGGGVSVDPWEDDEEVIVWIRY